MSLHAMWQLLLFIIVLYIRFSSGCLSRCMTCRRRCCLVCPCFKSGEPPEANNRNFQEARWCNVTWYWFHLAAQAGFIVREWQVTTLIDGWWYWQVVVSFAALSTTFLCTFWQVWKFSKVRNIDPDARDAVDQVLDTLMLPLNYCYLATATVRVLETQSVNQELMIATVAGANAWQSWALWSALSLFVRVEQLGRTRTPKSKGDVMDGETPKIGLEVSQPYLKTRSASPPRRHSPLKNREGSLPTSQSCSRQSTQMPNETCSSVLGANLVVSEPHRGREETLGLQRERRNETIMPIAENTVREWLDCSSPKSRESRVGHDHGELHRDERVCSRQESVSPASEHASEDLQTSIADYENLLDEAIAEKNIKKVYNLFEEMAESDNKKMFEKARLTEKAWNGWEDLSQKVFDDFKQKHKNRFVKLKCRNDGKPTLALASCPASGLDGTPILRMAEWLVLEAGGHNIAGDADHWFHKSMMDKIKMTDDTNQGRRSAWEGRTAALLARTMWGEIYLFSLKGGKENDWEREYLLNDLRTEHPNKTIKVRCLQGLDELISALQEMNAEEASAPPELPTCLLEMLESENVTCVSKKHLDLAAGGKLVYNAIRRKSEGAEEPVFVLYSKKGHGENPWVWNFDKELGVLRALADDEEERNGRHHVVKMYNHFYADGNARGPCMVMEAVKPAGWDLSRLINLHIINGERMPISEMQQFFVDVAKGVSYLHLKGYVHCDLKTDHVLISGRPHHSAKVVDFGLATQIGESIDSPWDNHRAPENCKGAKATEEMDVYGLGYILSHMWADACMPEPRTDLDDAELRTDLDDAMKDACSNLMAPEPSKRWSLATLLGPEDDRPKFLTVQRSEFQQSERWYDMRDEVEAAKSMQLCKIHPGRINICPHTDCALVKVDMEMSGKTLQELGLGASHNMLVLLIQRAKDKEYVTVPKGETEVEIDDKLYIAGRSVDELSVKKQLLVRIPSLGEVPLSTFYPEFDQFHFPSNCYGAVVGPAKFAKAGQKALLLREEFGINLVAIQRRGELITAADIHPQTEIEEDDIGIVCRLPKPNGFSTSILSDTILTRLAKVGDLTSSAPATSTRKDKPVKRMSTRISEPSAKDKEAGTAERYEGVMSMLKKVCEYGVIAWVVCQVLASILDIFVIGVVAEYFPTYCNWALGSCTGCSEYYVSHISPMIQGALILLAFMATLLVYFFDRSFPEAIQGNLKRIEPAWSSIKSKSICYIIFITLGQYLILRLRFPEQRVQGCMSNSLVCCVEMALLAIFHHWAYRTDGDLEWVRVVLSSKIKKEIEKGKEKEAGRGWDNLVYMFVIAFSFYSSHMVIERMIPADWDILPSVPLSNKFCTDNISSVLDQTSNVKHMRASTSMSPWLPLCKGNQLRCAPGYAGNPYVNCSAQLKLSFHGRCNIVGCGPPSPIAHAVAEFDPQHTSQVWTSGMHVYYKCNLGYHGSPAAVCGPDGNWNLVGSECSLVGCGVLQSFLQSSIGTRWKDFMSPMVSNTSLRTSSHDGDTVEFKCHKGLIGKPVATCLKGGNWVMADACTRFQTAKGCSCERRWTHCRGLWPSVCFDFFGCATGAGHPFAWCRVKPGSCPSASLKSFGREPAWDYCIAHTNNSWVPEPAPSEGWIPLLRFMGLAFCFCFSSAIVAWCCFHLAKLSVTTCNSLQPRIRSARNSCSYTVRHCPGCIRRYWRIVSYTACVRWEHFEVWMRRRKNDISIAAESAMQRVSRCLNELRGQVSEKWRSLMDLLSFLRSRARERCITFRHHVDGFASDVKQRICVCASGLRERCCVYVPSTSDVSGRLSDFGKNCCDGARNARDRVYVMVPAGRDNLASRFRMGTGKSMSEPLLHCQEATILPSGIGSDDRAAVDPTQLMESGHLLSKSSSTTTSWNPSWNLCKRFRSTSPRNQVSKSSSIPLPPDEHRVFRSFRSPRGNQDGWSWSKPIEYADGNFWDAIREALHRDEVAEDVIRTRTGKIMTVDQIWDLVGDELRSLFMISVKVKASNNDLAKWLAELGMDDLETSLKQDGIIRVEDFDFVENAEQDLPNTMEVLKSSPPVKLRKFNANMDEVKQDLKLQRYLVKKRAEEPKDGWSKPIEYDFWDAMRESLQRNEVAEDVVRTRTGKIMTVDHINDLAGHDRRSLFPISVKA